MEVWETREARRRLGGRKLEMVTGTRRREVVVV